MAVVVVVRDEVAVVAAVYDLSCTAATTVPIVQCPRLVVASVV